MGYGLINELSSGSLRNFFNEHDDTFVYAKKKNGEIDGDWITVRGQRYFRGADSYRSCSIGKKVSYRDDFLEKCLTDDGQVYTRKIREILKEMKEYEESFEVVERNCSDDNDRKLLRSLMGKKGWGNYHWSIVADLFDDLLDDRKMEKFSSEKLAKLRFLDEPEEDTNGIGEVDENGLFIEETEVA